MSRNVVVVLNVVFILLFCFYLRDVVRSNNEKIMDLEVRIKIQQQLIKEKDSILIEQIKMLGKSIDSGHKLYDYNGRVHSILELIDKLILYFPSDGCSNCSTETLLALKSSGIRLDEIVVVSDFYSLRELKIFKQSFKQDYTAMQIKGKLQEQLEFSFMYPFIFSINENGKIDFFFCCQSHNITLDFLKIIKTDRAKTKK